ncbi:MAG: hypothetical protein RBS80_29090, partial [Thermoguttaceae bacterium]|nr:hypothetical protein [Thermoguttaceae bacterium]
MKHQCLLWGVLVLGCISAGAHAATIHWVGGGADNHWSTGANWDPFDTDPSGDALHYDNGVAVNVATLSGTVDGSYLVASMRLNNLSAGTDPTPDPLGNRLYTFHVPSGTTLTVSGAASIGYQFSTWTEPEIKRNRYYVTGLFAGGGEMVVNGPLTVRNAGSGSPAQPATLDVSGLSKFTVDTTGNIHLGGTNNGRGVLILAPDNLLKAANIYAPGAQSWATGGLMSSLLLGEQNTLQADNIFVGGWGLYGQMLFQSGLANPTVAIRNRAGTGPANLYIGDMRQNDRTVAGTVDFTGGTVDAELDQLQLGIVHIRAAVVDRTPGATGTLTMSAGRIGANHVILGRMVNGDVNPNRLWADGILNVQGGEFGAGSIVLGQDEANNDRARGTINFTGGTLSAGTIQKGVGGGEAIFNFTGGTLHV